LDLARLQVGLEDRQLCLPQLRETFLQLALEHLLYQFAQSRLQGFEQQPQKLLKSGLAFDYHHKPANSQAQALLQAELSHLPKVF
jgi:hypothetical protein